MAVGIYRHNNYYHHGGYYGGHYHGGHNTVIINDRDNFNNYNNNKMRSNTVADNKALLGLWIRVNSMIVEADVFD